jgi:uncharacterized membrane protein HdeD (DUF308 family)
VAALVWPGITALTLLFVIAAWSIVRGVFEIGAAIRLRRTIEREWLLVLSGIISVLFGALLMASPGIGLMVLVWLAGAYAFVFGLVLTVLSFKLRGYRERPDVQRYYDAGREHRL